MKTGLILLIIGILFSGFRLYQRIEVTNEYSTKVGNYWDLADKASTIIQKKEYIDKFVTALDSQNLNGVYASMIFENPSTLFDENYKALKSLQARLDTIQIMDESSFAYQTAIQQITQQEQGEAINMLNVFDDCWLRINHYSLWNPFIVGSFFLIQVILILLGLIFLIEY